MLRDEPHTKQVLSSTIQSNDFGLIHLEPIGFSGDFSPGRYGYASEAENTLDIINLQGVFNSLANSDHTLAMDLISQWKTQAEMETAEYQEALEEVASNIYFLSGDMNKGGIFFYKTMTGSTAFLNLGCLYGFLEEENSDPKRFRYLIGRDASHPYSFDQCEQVALSFQNYGYEDYPDLYAFARPVSPAKMYKYEPFTAQTGEEVTNLEDVLYTKEWVQADVAVEVPAVGWSGTVVQQIQFGQYPAGTSQGGAWNGGSSVNPNYNPYNGDSSGSDEDDTSKHTSDPIDIPDPNESGVDAINSGFITLYNPTKADVIAFNDYMFVTIDDTISEHLKRLISDPFDYLVFIALCHFHPTQSIVQKHIMLAGMDSGVSCPVIAQEWITLDCGSITIFADNKNFTDFSPYSKCVIFLPYVGFRELKIDEIRGGKLSVGYNIDLLTGSFTCFVKVERGYRGYWTNMTSADYPLNGIILTAEGNCFQMVPLSSTDFRSFYQGLLGVVGGAGQFIAGNPIGGLGAMASSVTMMKPTVNRSGQTSGNMGYMGYQTPYIMVTYPFGANPSNMGDYVGYPSNILQKIGSCNDAFVQIDTDTIWMDDIPCMDDEMTEIKQLLNEGVWVNV